MRLLLTATLLTVAAVPAAAQDRPAPTPSRERAIAEALGNPIVQSVIANALVGVSDAVMATRVGPLARYSDSIRPDDTLDSVQRRRDPDYRERLRARARDGLAVAGVAAGDAVAMADELRATADRLRDVLAPLAAAVRAR
jgi:hypothetical protein